MSEAEVIRLIGEVIALVVAVGTVMKYGLSKIATKADVSEVKQIAIQARDAALATNGTARRNVRHISHIEGFLQGQGYTEPRDE